MPAPKPWDALFQRASASVELLATPIERPLQEVPLSEPARRELAGLAGEAGTFGGLFVGPTLSALKRRKKVAEEILGALGRWVDARPAPERGAVEPPPVFDRARDAQRWLDERGVGHWGRLYVQAGGRSAALAEALLRSAKPELRDEATRWLTSRLWMRQERRRRREERDRVPVPDALRGRADALRQSREAMGAGASGGSTLQRPPVLGPGGVLEVAFASVEIERCACSYKGAEVQIGDDGPTCAYGKMACLAKAEACDWALEAFRGTFGPSYAQRLGRPRWEQELERLHGRSPPRKTEVDEVGWRFSESPWGIDLQLVRQGPGGWTDVGPKADLSRLEARDRLLAQVVRHESYKSHAKWVRELVGHPRVIDGVGRPLTVEIAKPSLRVRSEGNALVAEVLAGETPLPLLDYKRIEVIRDGDRILCLDVPDEAYVNLERVLELAPLLPPEAGPALLQRLGNLLRDVEIDIDPELVGPEVAAEPRPTVHLAAHSAGITVEAYVEPLPGGPRYAPGGGPARVMRSAAPAAHTQRDLAAERRLADEVLATLGLEGSGPWELGTPEDLLDLLARLDGLGDRVLVAWEGPPKRRLQKIEADKLNVTVRRTGDWLALGGNAEVDGVLVELELLLGAALAGRRAVLVANGVVEIEASLAEHLREVARIAGADGQQLPRLAAGEVAALEEAGVHVDGVPGWLAVVEGPRRAATAEIAVPSAFRGTLRDYQRDGFDFLARLALWAPGALLCDDMGLGKTLQALALLLHRAEAGPALVVAPMSVVENWRREAARFAPDLLVVVHQGSSRERELRPGAGQIVLTSWDLLVRDDEILGSVPWATVVFDEAHAAKNPTSKRAQAARQLPAAFRVGLTGTPVENRLSDLWSLAAIAVPGLFGTWDSFRTRFATPIENRRDPHARAALRRLLAPFLLRRTKVQVAADLPPREEIVERLTLSPAERATYDRARIAAKAEIESSGLPQPARRFLLLKALTKLRQLACDPALVEPATPGQATKIARLVERAVELRAEGRRALVFSSFVRLLDRAEAALREAGLLTLRLDGSTSAPDRASRVSAFQDGQADLFLISLKAGGVGLNLTAADTVLHLDPWWNPAAEAQAADRAHRIGQTRPVTIYKLVSEGTVEEGVLAMQADKRDLVASVLEDEGGAGPVSIEELQALVGFGGR